MSKIKLLILPGWEQHSAHWQVILNKLNGEFEAEVIDMPGFGHEPLVSNSWGVPEYAEWVRNKVNSEQLTVNGKKKIILLGHSFGGRVANYLACTHQPNWLQGLILYGAPIIYRPGTKTRLTSTFVKFAKSIFPSGTLPEAWRQKFYSSDLKDSQKTGKEEIFRRVVTFDQTSILSQNKYPTVLLWGQQDDSVDVSIAEELHSLYPHSELKVIRGEGHNFHLENPNLFYGTLKQILADVF